MQGIVLWIAPKKVISVLLVINLKEEEEDETLKPVDSSHCDSDLLGSPQTQDDEELRMLASLKREQEEDECKASGLSASQIHRCNVSIGMSSDDTSTWTHISLVCIVQLCYSSYFIDSSLTSSTCAAHLPLTIISTLFLFLSSCLEYFVWPGLILILAHFHFKPQLTPPWSANAPLPPVCFCIIKGYWDRNTLIGLFQFLNIHWRNIHMSLSD